MADFHRPSLKMAWLYLWPITYESTKTKNILKFKMRAVLAVELSKVVVAAMPI